MSVQAPAEEASPAEEAPAANPVSKDPRYVKFFKMLQFVSIFISFTGFCPDTLAVKQRLNIKRLIL
jgi:hypothetical protein